VEVATEQESGWRTSRTAAATDALCVGGCRSDDSIEAESLDRTSIDLPDIQHQLAAVIAAVGTPTVLVLFNGGMVDVTAERDNANIAAMVAAGYPGKRGAEAVAMTLFGQNDRLGGKLPYTVYPASYVNAIKMSEMEMDVSPGRTYRYYSGDVVFPFGFGLSLTTFTATVTTPSAPALHTESVPSQQLTYTVVVTNAGTVTGDDVVFLYMEPGADAGTTLRRQLVDYQRVHLQPAASATLTFTVTSASLRLVAKPSGDIVSTSGSFSVVVTDGVTEFARQVVTVTGPTVVAVPFPVPADSVSAL
jgi:hypothetical protein